MRFEVSKTFAWDGRLTEKVCSVMRMFGVDVERLDNVARHGCCLETEPGDVVYITGPSGSGKSVLLGELEKQLPADELLKLDYIALDSKRAVIDCVRGDVMSSLRILGSAGLSDVFCVLRKPIHLSDGQKYRFRLAVAIASGRKFILADEFCSNLDRLTAAVVAHNVRRFATEHKVTFLLASSHEDILADLSPDALVVTHLSGQTEVIYKRRRQSERTG